MAEIEAVLCQHPALSESAVIDKSELSGEKKLVAYVVLDHEPAPTIGELRAFLKKSLPDYMIPSTFVFAEALPLTPNRKVDREALKALAVEGLEQEETFVAPRNQIEQTVASIWAGILGLERVGVESNFFELGGHSLLVMQILSRVSAAFDLEIVVTSLIEEPTVAGLAKRIEMALKNEPDVKAASI
jgi:acyl carrier protein